MATYEDIRKANDAIRTTDIKGKEYAEVNQRIKAFRMVYPEGFIITDIIRNENGVCTMRAQCGFYDEKGEPQTLGIGTAYEKEGSTFINKTSYIENCETSAVGRALGMAGFGIDTSVASAEEVQNAIANQQASDENQQSARKASPKQIEIISRIYTGDRLARLLEVNQIGSIEELSMQKASELIARLQERKNQNA